MVNKDVCPVGNGGEAGLAVAADSVLAAERAQLFNWYINGGFRGCLFNKLAARDAKRDDFPWDVEVFSGDFDSLTTGDSGASLIESFRRVIDDEQSDAALASFVFPDITDPVDYGRLLRFLTREAPDVFKLFPIEDCEVLEVDDDIQEFVGIQFRIRLGATPDGEDIFSYPMIYSPDGFTTFARRYDKFKITFNPRTRKENPETPDTYIGVDDINLGLPDSLFDRLLERSLEVNRDAHSFSGKLQDGEQGYSRGLFRAHNALVLPLDAWEASDDVLDDQEAGRKSDRELPATELGGLVVKASADTTEDDTGGSQAELVREDSQSTAAQPEKGSRKQRGDGGSAAKKPATGATEDGYVHQKGKRGHPMTQVKRNLAQQGKLNAKKPMSPEQRKARRKKRKR